jgi:hypothetical protein
MKSDKLSPPSNERRTRRFRTGFCTTLLSWAWVQSRLLRAPLYDEIEVAPPRDAWDATKDAWIAARLRSEFVLDAEIRSGNYTIETENGSVY